MSFRIFTAGLAAFASLAAAYTQPTGDSPVGNPISEPGLGSIVPAGSQYTVTWQPTTQGTVTLVLLKGPSSNAVPQYAIVEKIPNDGSYVWSVADDLVPSDPSTPSKGYGIQLIDDATGQYQYTTQFGISNADYNGAAASSSSSSSSSAVASSSSWTSAAWPATTETCTDSTAVASATSSAWTSVGTAASSGVITPSANVTMAAPTGGYVPTTVATTYTKPSSPASSPSVTPYKGAASTVATSFFGLAAAGLVAMMAI